MATLLLEKRASVRVQAAEPAPGPWQQDQFRLERGLALMLIVVAAVYLRAHDPLYSSAYMDESVYVVYGRMFLARHFEAPLAHPLQWSFGWYLWPMMAALADRIGGLVALRELAALLGTLTVAATYGFASRVFSKTVGLGAAAVMAVLGPAVMVSRIATRDSGAVCFFALGLWAFACAWQENRKRQWVLAGLALFAAFLCKYLVAIYFPVLVLMALWKGRKALLCFAAPLSAASAAYLLRYWRDLSQLLHYGSDYNSLRATDALGVYVSNRWDFWLIAAVAVFGLAHRVWWRRTVAMLAAASIALGFQCYARADYDFWKHANYALFFLVPAAISGGLLLVRMLTPSKHHRQLIWGVSGVLTIAAAVGILGGVNQPDRWLFWPSVDPAMAYMQGRLTPQDRVLVDDTVFRYYLTPTLRQAQITDPMFAAYHDATGRELSGPEASRAAVSEGAFSYIVLDGGIGTEAQQMDEAIRPMLAAYKLDFYATDPVLGRKIEIYSRAAAAPDAVTATTTTAPEIFILSPANGAVMNTANTAAELVGVTVGAQPAWYVKVEVFTDHWHIQGEAVPVTGDGRFREKITLAGEGPQQCSHLVRATLFDGAGKARASAMNYGIGRAGCMAQAAL